MKEIKTLLMKLRIGNTVYHLKRPYSIQHVGNRHFSVKGMTYNEIVKAMIEIKKEIRKELVSEINYDIKYLKSLK